VVVRGGVHGQLWVVELDMAWQHVGDGLHGRCGVLFCQSWIFVILARRVMCSSSDEFE